MSEHILSEVVFWLIVGQSELWEPDTGLCSAALSTQQVVRFA